VRETWIEKTYTGFIPGERVGIHFEGNWVLDTGPGNIFAEIEGDSTPNRVSFPNAGYDFWTIDSALSGDIQDAYLAANADSNGEVIVRLGGEGFAPSCNISCSFSRVQVVRCTSGTGSDASGPSSEPVRYVTRWLADASARQQMRGWKFYIEQSADGGVTWPEVLYAGYLTSLELPEELVYVFTIGDTRRVERNTTAWRNVNPINNTSDAHPTALSGGPIYGGFLPYQVDRGLPLFEVIDQSAASSGINPYLLPDGWVKLEYKSGPLPASGIKPPARDQRRFPDALAGSPRGPRHADARAPRLGV